MKELLKSRVAKWIAAGLAVLLVVGTVFSTGALSLKADAASGKATKKTKTEKEIEKNYPELLRSSGAASVDKVETTYVVMGSDSDVQETVVEEQLANANGDENLADYSTLKDIENTSGDEKFEKSGNNLTWSAKGNSINYKGTPTESLPIKVKVNYYLDGERMNAKEIAGKSGNVKIEFNYSVSKMDSVNGYYLTHPYTVASGLMLDNEHFSDVNVSNGKAVNDGSKTIAVGIAMPGMNENLGISKANLDIPDKVVVTAYTDNFQFDGTYTIAMSGGLNDLSSNSSNAVNNVEGKVAELENGLTQLSDASNKLVSGTNELKDGTSQLKSGVAQLKDGSNKELSGLNELNDGLQELTANSQAINDGTAQIETEFFATATEQLNKTLKEKDEDAADVTLTPKTYIQVIQGISDGAIKKADGKLRAGLVAAAKDQGIDLSGKTELQTQILSLAYNELVVAGKAEPTEADITAAVKSAATKAGEAEFVKNATDAYTTAAVQYLMKQGMTQEQIQASQDKVLVTAITMAIARQKGYTDIAVLPESAVEQMKNAAIGYARDAAAFQGAATKADENVVKLEAMAVGKETPKALADLKASLDNLEKYVAGVRQYTAGVDAAAQGSAQLVDGMNQINDGINTLSIGVNKLDAGAIKLNEGMNQFNKDGVQKFVSSLSDAQLSRISGRLRATAEASKSGSFVGGKSDNMSGESKLIFKTAAVNASK